MTDKTAKELSRRDALKLLGAAAGATVLANLPSKWSTPELTAGVLPAHAQTSACTLGLYVLIESTSVQEGPLVLSLLTPVTPPDSSSGVWVVDAPSWVRWDCDPACILVMTSITSGTGTVEFSITVGNQPSFNRVISNSDGISDSYWIYVNAATGTYAEGYYGTTPALEGCPEVAP